MNPREIKKDHAIKRASVPAMDEILGWEFPVLDHGFIRVIDYMGDQGAITQAARVSYGEGTKTVQDDDGLLNYLLRHHHTTPFEMCEIKLHVKLPVFVARQWVRHRTANINEYSARYSILDREFYIPEIKHMAMQSVINNQGRGQVLEPEKAKQIQDWLLHDAEHAYDSYTAMMLPETEGGEYGLARELARMNLPTNIYTQWYWKTDLWNLLNFMRLRADSHAQYEIRVYAEVIEHIVATWVPSVFGAYFNYIKHSISLSAKEQRAFALLVNTEQGQVMLETLRNVDTSKQENMGSFSKGEWKEFLNKLDKMKK